MKDIILTVISKIANNESQPSLDITLCVGGFLISGTIVSYETYMEHNGFTQFLEEVIQSAPKDSDAQSSETNNADAEDDLPDFVHLSNAKYFTPGGNPIPGNEGLFVRVNLESVHSFSFGKLEIAS